MIFNIGDGDMTIQQEAYSLIDTLSDDDVKAIVNIMIRMLPTRSFADEATNSGSVVPDRKMQAFNRLKELRKIAAESSVIDFDIERENGVRGKYGEFM